MNIVVPQTGIDVSKLELVVSIDQAKPFKLPNTLEECLELAKRLPRNGVVHIEASGGYERLIHRTLESAAIKVVLHNALKTRRMAQALGTRAKTDPVDAKALSRDGARLPEGSVKSLQRQQLADHSRAVDALKDMASRLKKSKNMPEIDPVAKQIFEGAISDLENRIVAAEKAFAKRVKGSECAQGYGLAKSIPAVGPVTSRVVICELPEDFRVRTTEQISSYAGLAPVDDQSGKRVGKSRLGRGNARLKACLYMPSITAIRTQKWARDLYARLRSKGKSHQTALVAVMRRLLLRIVAVLKRGTPWEDVPQIA